MKPPFSIPEKERSSHRSDFDQSGINKNKTASKNTLPERNVTSKRPLLPPNNNFNPKVNVKKAILPPKK